MEKLKPKLFSVMKGYDKSQFVKDVVAGIIVAIIALPLSIALAIASGVTPAAGIYTAIIAGFSFSLGFVILMAGFFWSLKETSIKRVLVLSLMSFT